MEYKDAEKVLKGKGWQVWKHIDEDTLVDGLEVPVSPDIILDKAQEIQAMLPEFKVSPGKGRKYVLIKKKPNESIN